MILIDRIRARLVSLPRRVVVPGPVPPALCGALESAAREKWARPTILVPPGDRPPSLPDVRAVTHDDTLIRRYLDAWMALRGSRGVGEREARDELSHPESMAAALVASGEADVVVSASDRPVAPNVLRAPGATISRLFMVSGNEAGNERMAWVIEAEENGDPSAEHLAQLALRALELAGKCTAGESGVADGRDSKGVLEAQPLPVSGPNVRFVVGTVTASLTTRRLHESEESATLSRVAEACETVRARARAVEVAVEPVRGFPALGPTPAVLVVSTPSGEDLRYRLERDYPGARVTGPLVQGTRIPVCRIDRKAATESILAELPFLLLG